MGLVETELDSALTFSHLSRAEHELGDVGLGWFSTDFAGDTEIFHTGALISGWRSQIRFSRARKLGVIVLARLQQSSINLLYDIGPYDRHIFDASLKLNNNAFNRKALPLNFVSAIYPESLKDKSLTGSVIVELTVDPRGNVVESRIFESKLPEAFDSAAIAAARKFKFQPRLENGRKVAESGVTYKFDF